MLSVLTYDRSMNRVEFPRNSSCKLTAQFDRRTMHLQRHARFVHILYCSPQSPTREVHTDSFEKKDYGIHYCVLLSTVADLASSISQVTWGRRIQEAGVNFIETLFTQWRSSVGVLKPSPLNTWPRCPPQAVHVISTLLPSGSGVRCIAPGSPSKKAGQPQPESNLVVDLYRGVPQPAQLYTPLP